MPQEQQSAADLLRRSAEYLRAGRPREARDACEMVLRAEPANPQAAYSFGLIAHKAGNHEDAVHWFRFSMALTGPHPSVLNNVAEAYRTLGRLVEADGCYREALRLDPNLAQAHNGLGLVCQALGRSAEAAAHFSEAVRLQPDYAKAHRNLGRALQDLGRGEEAWDCFDRAQACSRWPENTSAGSDD